MPLQVVATHQQLVDAINEFSANYHADYFRIRPLALEYLNNPFAENTEALARELSAVLYSWGAGRRGAPNVLPLEMVQQALTIPALHNLLTLVSGSPLTTLSLHGGVNRAIHGTGTAPVRAAFDANLQNALVALSTGIFAGNTNVTYPMKALLLITGLMPALDSQVRRGLGSAGFAGIGAWMNQFKLPGNRQSANALKLTRLPFLLADCYANHANLLTGAGAASRYPGLSAEIGRLFDVLFFIQGSAGYPVFTLNPPARDWYRLP